MIVTTCASAERSHPRCRRSRSVTSPLMTRCFGPFFSARPYPSDSAGIEGGEAETAVLQMIEDDRCDQKPRYNEEDIDTDKATSKGVGEPVKNHDGHYGNGAKTVDVAA